MSQYVFSPVKRLTIFLEHGDRCYLNGEPLDLETMQVDHILPEYLADDPVKLSKILAEYGLPPTFDLNSYENWLPSCGPCNNKKSGRVFNAAPILLVHFDKARNKADACRKREAKSVGNAALMKSIGHLMAGLHSGDLDKDKLKPLVLAYLDSSPEARRAVREKLDSYSIDFSMGLMVVPEFAISPKLKVVFQSGGYRFA